MKLSGRVLLLTGPGLPGCMAYHSLDGLADEIKVIRETAPSRWQLIRNRARKLGVRRVAGQLVFQTVASPVLARMASSRIQEIYDASELDTSPIPDAHVYEVGSINLPEVVSLVQTYAPTVIAVVGTRIIGRRLLESIEVPIFNLHAGITPSYRGVHGGYWALANRDPQACGVTIHQVDPGIDTGKVVAQALISPSAQDTFATYPTLQFAAGMPLLRTVVGDALQGRTAEFDTSGRPSKLYYHPTIGEYLTAWFMYGVK